MQENLVVYLVGVPLFGITAQWLAWRLRLPAILLLLGCGIGLGQFVDPDQLLSEVTVGARASGPRLLFPAVSLDLNTRIAILVGAILVVTGPTVVGPLLRQIRPARRVGTIAKWEGIVIDPIGAGLVVPVFQEVLVSARLLTVDGVMLVLSRCAGIAVVLGFLAAWFLVESARRYWLPDYLQGSAFLAVALAAFATSNAFQAESGLATMALMGVIPANQRTISIRHVTEFNEHSSRGRDRGARR
jgi:CPA1 family monovalent cation:H+ antiporter